MTGVLKLLTNAGADSGADVEGDFKFWSGGPGDFTVWFDDMGSFGGGVVELQATPNDGDSVICITSVSIPSIVRFTLNHGFKLRAVIAETTSASSKIFAEVF